MCLVAWLVPWSSVFCVLCSVSCRCLLFPSFASLRLTLDVDASVGGFARIILQSTVNWCRTALLFVSSRWLHCLFILYPFYSAFSVFTPLSTAWSEQGCLFHSSSRKILNLCNGVRCQEGMEIRGEIKGEIQEKREERAVQSMDCYTQPTQTLNILKRDLLSCFLHGKGHCSLGPCHLYHHHYSTLYFVLVQCALYYATCSLHSLSSPTGLCLSW